MGQLGVRPPRWPQFAVGAGILLRADSTWGRGGGATGHNSTLSRAVLGQSHRCTMSVGVAWCSNAREESEKEKKNERKMKKKKRKNVNNTTRSTTV